VDETRLPEWRERLLRLLCFALAAALILYFFSLVANVLLLIFAGILSRWSSRRCSPPWRRLGISWRPG
jgi:hypothetical protein